MVASTSPTGTVCSASVRISVITPSAGASTSNSTLSLSAESSTSPFATVSPTAFFQATTVLSCTLVPMRGILMRAVYMQAPSNVLDAIENLFYSKIRKCAR